jgi:hypothetical protein
MTELTLAQLSTIVGGIPSGPPPPSDAPRPYHRTPSAKLGSPMPKWAARMHDQAAKAFAGMAG